jgi:dTDP-4-dehydrorhamnose reductase
VGMELQRSLSPLGKLNCMGRQDLNLADLAAVSNCIEVHRPDFIVNAAAYTKVDQAEIEQEEAEQLNARAVQVLGEEAFKLGAWLVHYSTDYVFDGKKGSAYDEGDPALPLNAYGRSKLNGENAIRKSRCKHLIFRSSWVYSIHRQNFPVAIMRRAVDGTEMKVVSDTHGAPTSASLIADITSHAIYRINWDPVVENIASGTYHLVASGTTSWYEYAKFIVDIARKRGFALKITPDRISPVSSDFYSKNARRPRNSRLNNTKICETFDINLPKWQIDAERFIDELVRARPV